jgi:hypothetical protein
VLRIVQLAFSALQPCDWTGGLEGRRLADDSAYICHFQLQGKWIWRLCWGPCSDLGVGGVWNGGCSQFYPFNARRVRDRVVQIIHSNIAFVNSHFYIETFFLSPTKLTANTLYKILWVLTYCRNGRTLRTFRRNLLLLSSEFWTKYWVGTHCYILKNERIVRNV